MKLLLLICVAAAPIAAQTADSGHSDDRASDTVRHVEVVNGRVLGGWSTWRESPDMWGYASDRHIQFPRTGRLTLDAAGLPVHFESTGEIGGGVPWFECFERDGGTARWSTPRERGEVAAAAGSPSCSSPGSR